MLEDVSKLLTTSAAAELCSVKADTVLKWIKKGKLRAIRTAGGHNRINWGDLEAFLRARRAGVQVQIAGDSPARPLRCWEFFSDRGVLRGDCKACPVHRVRAALCYEMLGKGTSAGHAKLFCQNSCEDCAYYQRVKGLKVHVLVLTQDQDLIRHLTGEENPGLSLRVVHNGYEASAAIHDFRPGFAVVDSDLFQDGGVEMADCLTNDPRVPGLRIVLAKSPARRRRTRTDGISAFAVLVKPFGPDLLARVVNGQPVEPEVSEASH